MSSENREPMWITVNINSILFLFLLASYPLCSFEIIERWKELLFKSWHISGEKLTLFPPQYVFTFVLLQVLPFSTAIFPGTLTIGTIKKLFCSKILLIVILLYLLFCLHRVSIIKSPNSGEINSLLCSPNKI